jgi:excinuclease UvrABC ATPase subunit
MSEKILSLSVGETQERIEELIEKLNNGDLDVVYIIDHPDMALISYENYREYQKLIEDSRKS